MKILKGLAALFLLVGSLSAQVYVLNQNGNTATTTISVTAWSGYTGTVNLSVTSAAITGVTTGFAPASLTFAGPGRIGKTKRRF